MPIIFDGNGGFYDYTPPPPDTEASATAHQSTIVDDTPHISLNRQDNAQDKSHLYMEGPLASDDNFIRIRDKTQEVGNNADGSEDLFRVDRLGNLQCGAIQIYCSCHRKVCIWEAPTEVNQKIKRLCPSSNQCQIGKNQQSFPRPWT